MVAELEIYAFHLQNKEPNHYTRVPNIVSELTYTENGKTKNLSVYARELYRIIKQTAGEHGVCFKCIRTLAKEGGMSVGSASKARKELEKHFDQIGGPLIKIEERKKASVQDGAVKNKTTYHLITVIDIWGHCNAHYHLKAKIKAEACSPHERAGGACSPHEHATQEACSRGDTKQEHTNKNPLSKEQQPAAAAAIVASSKKERKRLFASEGQRIAYTGMVRAGCREPSAYQIAIAYSDEEIKEACAYARQQGKVTQIKNQWGYIQKTLQNKWWRKKHEQNRL